VPDVIYTWDHGIGEPGLGNNVETWAKNFGANDLTLDNSIDGILSITETGAAGSDWAINESFNRVKESFNGADYGGLDLTGLDALEIDISHDGPNTIFGQLIAWTVNDFTVLGPISVDAGGLQTESVSISHLSPLDISTVRSLGVQIFGHEADGNRVWQISELRSAGSPLSERLIADHDDGANDFDGVLINFNHNNVIGNTAPPPKNRDGLNVNTVDGSLQWAETPGDGVGLEWGGGDNLLNAEDFQARPMDLRQYRLAEVVVRAQSTAPGESIGVQFYMQNEEFMFYPAESDQNLVADGTYQTLLFRITNIPNRDQVNIHGINFHEHTGSVQFNVSSFRYLVPEPSAVVLCFVGAMAMLGGLRKRD
jgi:hypothetical protein